MTRSAFRTAAMMATASLCWSWAGGSAGASADAGGSVAAEDGGAPAEVGGGADGGTDAIVDRTVPPVALAPITPVYPPDAAAAGIEGDVTLILTIDDLGRVTKVEIEEAALGGLTEAAAAAARAAHFRPATDARGRPMAARIRWNMHFTLPEQRNARASVSAGPAPGAPPPAAPVVPPTPPDAAPLPPNVERFPIGAGGTLAILVRERGTGKLLPEATVYIEDMGELIHLDDKARAERALPPGAYAVVIRAPGHHQDERIERIHPGERLQRAYFV